MSEDMKVILENFSKFKDFFKQREEERVKEFHRRQEEEKRKEEEEKRKKEEEKIAFYRKRGPKFEFRPHRSMRYSTEKDGKIYDLAFYIYDHGTYFYYNGREFAVPVVLGRIERALAGKKELRSYLQGFKDRVEKNNFPKIRRYQEMLPHAKEAIPAVEELLNSGLLDLTDKEKEFENRPPPSREELIEEIEGVLFTNDPEDREQVHPAVREYARFLVDRRLLTQILKYLKSKQ